MIEYAINELGKTALLAPLLIIGVGVSIGLIRGVASFTLGMFLGIIEALNGDDDDDEL